MWRTFIVYAALFLRTEAGRPLNEGRPTYSLPDRSLYVKNIPEVLGYTSTVYQVYMPSLPYPYQVQPIMAVAQLKGDNMQVEGTVVFVQPHPPEGPVFVSGNITGLSPGLHGFHIHTKGDLRNGCMSAGPHYNPFMVNHGAATDPFRHIGDLGNIEAREDGTAYLQISDNVISLTGSQSIVGRSVVVHKDTDDLGRGGNTESLASGNAGQRLACGVIGLF